MWCKLNYVTYSILQMNYLPVSLTGKQPPSVYRQAAHNSSDGGGRLEKEYQFSQIKLTDFINSSIQAN